MIEIYDPIKWRIEIHPRGGYVIRSPGGKLITGEGTPRPHRYESLAEACADIATLNGDPHWCEA